MHVYGRRMRSGGSVSSGGGATFGFVALYNDTVAGHILRIFNWLAVTTGAGHTIAFTTQGAVGSLVRRGDALFTGEQAMDGSIYSGADATAPPLGVNLSPTAAAAQSPEARPWWYLRPGFSLVFKSDAVNVATYGNFWWEDLEISMLSQQELM